MKASKLLAALLLSLSVLGCDQETDLNAPTEILEAEHSNISPFSVSDDRDYIDHSYEMPNGDIVKRVQFNYYKIYEHLGDEFTHAKQVKDAIARRVMSHPAIYGISVKYSDIKEEWCVDIKVDISSDRTGINDRLNIKNNVNNIVSSIGYDNVCITTTVDFRPYIGNINPYENMDTRVTCGCQFTDCEYYRAPQCPDPPPPPPPPPPPSPQIQAGEFISPDASFDSRGTIGFFRRVQADFIPDYGTPPRGGDTGSILETRVSGWTNSHVAHVGHYIKDMIEFRGDYDGGSSGGEFYPFMIHHPDFVTSGNRNGDRIGRTASAPLTAKGDVCGNPFWDCGAVNDSDIAPIPLEPIGTPNSSIFQPVSSYGNCPGVGSDQITITGRSVNNPVPGDAVSYSHSVYGKNIGFIGDVDASFEATGPRWDGTTVKIEYRGAMLMSVSRLPENGESGSAVILGHGNSGPVAAYLFARAPNFAYVYPISHIDAFGTGDVDEVPGSCQEINPIWND